MTVLRSVPVAVNARRPAAGVKAELAHPKGMALTPARTGASSNRREQTEDPPAADHRHNAADRTRALMPKRGGCHERQKGRSGNLDERFGSASADGPRARPSLVPWR